MGVFAVAAIFSELGNGANFALVPHCNAYNNVGLSHPCRSWSGADFLSWVSIRFIQGVMSGIVGASGNVGGILFALIFRMQPARGRAWWIMGVVCTAINVAISVIPVPVN
jgi:NNP family nitrate/nitrite transporter-like MFS transporter